MIGVIANPSERAAACEFFELFKTPWEYYRSGRQYDVLLCAGDGAKLREMTAPLVVTYAGRELPSDTGHEIESTSPAGSIRILSYKGDWLPIYEGCVVFSDGAGILDDTESRRPAVYLGRSPAGAIVRIGYSLFREVRRLLTLGQPASNAGIPALELHIAVLRDLIVANGIRLVEIPPVPKGFRFLACLTHDVDHASIRRHKFDRTMFGFLYRATVGSFIRTCRGRLSPRRMLSNWAAALKLPLVHLGLVRDFWSGFDRYAQIENGIRSSFFVIPFKDRPGRAIRGQAPGPRASRYDAGDITPQIRTLLSAGCEVALHGIDAWLDSSSGREELNRIRSITGVHNTGVRMHWLYFDEHSPELLERAGADYDSSVGYNETVGYRAGTTQAYKPLQAMQLLELPLHVMDTALFFPGHLELTHRKAWDKVRGIVDNAARFGGCVTVNWHDRSIAPERFWGDFYVRLVDTLKDRGAWFATAAQAVSWFRKRRSATFETVNWESDTVHVKVAFEAGDDVPDLQLRVHNGGEWRQNTAARTASSGRKHTIDTCVALS